MRSNGVIAMLCNGRIIYLAASRKHEDVGVSRLPVANNGP
jgi:hypothetical protein